MTESALDFPSLVQMIQDKKLTFITDRKGQKQPIDISKIKQRLVQLAEGLDHNYINIDLVMKKVVAGMTEGIHTSQLDNLAAETCAYMNFIHPHYS